MTACEFLHLRSNFNCVSFSSPEESTEIQWQEFEADRFGLKFKWVHFFKG